MKKYKVAGENEVLGLMPGGVLEVDEVLGLKGYDLNALVESGHLAEVPGDTPVGPAPKPKAKDDSKAVAPKAKPEDPKPTKDVK